MKNGYFIIAFFFLIYSFFLTICINVISKPVKLNPALQVLEHCFTIQVSDSVLLLESVSAL